MAPHATRSMDASKKTNRTFAATVRQLTPAVKLPRPARLGLSRVEHVSANVVTLLLHSLEADHDHDSDTDDGVDIDTDDDDGIPTERFVAGVTLDQIDALDRLIQMISAHGDVVSASDMADFADYTLTMMGHAIFDEAEAVRDILVEVDAQRLPRAVRSRSGVKEEPAIYTAWIAPVADAGALHEDLDFHLENGSPAYGARVNRSEWEGLLAEA